MISIQGLTKYYGETCAVNDVSLEISKGEVLGLLGPNGAGKTTTMRILTCYLPPTSGTVTVKDLDIDTDSLEVRRLIGYLPEAVPIYPEMLVYDYLHYVADIRGLRGDAKLRRIGEIADLCGLNEVMHRTVNEISKGYLQRVGLAHAMMSDPEILILDEPTSGLDPNQIVEIRSIIKEIGKEKTVILSTHILTEAEATCDRIVIINQGKIVADGTTASLGASASDETEVRCLVDGASFEEMRGLVSGVPGVLDVAEGKPEGADAAAMIRCSGDIRGELYRVIKETEWTLLEFRQERKSLENIFRTLTKER